MLFTFILLRVDKAIIKKIVSAFLKIKRLVITLVMYFLLLIYILNQIGFWESRLWKSALIWFIFAGFAVTFRAILNAKDTSYFKKMLKDNIKIIILFQFIVNLYSFGFIWEVILVFIATFLTVLKVLLENHPDFKKRDDAGYLIINKLVNTLLSVIGFTILFYSAINFLNDNSVDYIDKTQDLFLPIILSFLLMPFIYIFVLYVNYELLFVRLSFNKTIDEKIRKYLYIQILIACNININKIATFTTKSGISRTRMNTKDDVKGFIYDYKREWDEEERVN
ncbi:hypothetical protein [Thalassobacillus hwangdonensis]|uniref:hypothetical protein n=1 Tax=Thalassobacillus hwangdonensis TaxID=546108 RepID=UPI0036DCD441